jgi:hypothetical protein
LARIAAAARSPSAGFRLSHSSGWRKFADLPGGRALCRIEIQRFRRKQPVGMDFAYIGRSRIASDKPFSKMDICAVIGVS